jgi:hypothetical protein
MTSRPILLAGLALVGAAPCAAPPVPPRAPALCEAPGVCLRLTADQLMDLALGIGASGVTVETPCLEVAPQ